RLHVRGHAAVVAKRHAGPEQEVELMGRSAGRQAGDFAAADIANHADPLGNINRERAARTLAAGARSSLARVDSDILILSRNFHATALLGLSNAGREQCEPEQNE